MRIGVGTVTKVRKDLLEKANDKSVSYRRIGRPRSLSDYFATAIVRGLGFLGWVRTGLGKVGMEQYPFKSKLPLKKILCS